MADKTLLTLAGSPGRLLVLECFCLWMQTRLPLSLILPPFSFRLSILADSLYLLCNMYQRVWIPRLEQSAQPTQRIGTCNNTMLGPLTSKSEVYSNIIQASPSGLLPPTMLDPLTSMGKV